MKNFYAFKNVDSEEQAGLTIYDEIGFWGVTAKSFHETLKTIKAKKLMVNINSPGGSVVDGYAIYNMLRAFKGEVTVVVDGIAASIASVIAMAGKKIIMPENALMYIHDPLVGMFGNAEELRKTAEDLDKIKESILSIFEARTGADRAKISAMMADETMMTAKEAKALGFCDEILPENRAVAKFDVKQYFDERNSAKVASAFQPIPTSANAAVGLNHTTKENDMKLTLEQAEARITVLEGENTQLKTSVEEARNKAQQDATTAVNTAESARKTALKAFADKYNKDGDLNGVLIDALSGTTTVEEFKDKVLEVVNNRASKPAIRKTESGAQGEGFEAEYKAAKNVNERRAVIRKYPAEARKALRSE